MRLLEFDMGLWDSLRDQGFRHVVALSVQDLTSRTKGLSFLVVPFHEVWEAESYLDRLDDPSHVFANIMDIDELGKEIFWEGFGMGWAEFLIDLESLNWNWEKRPAA